MTNLLGEDGATVLGLDDDFTPNGPAQGDELLIVIPARGGSQRLRRKNLLPVYGRPMFINTATDVGLPPGRVVVSTDDDEIASIARSWGLEVHRRLTVPDNQSVPDATALVVRDLEWTGPVLTIQPTIVPLPPLHDINEITESSVLVCTGQHDIWLPSETRIGRELADQILGIYYWPPGCAGEHPTTGLATEPALDIDTPLDYQLATFQPADITIISAPSTTWNGSGHARRQQELALLLQHHNVDSTQIPDLVILDRGSTTVDYIAQVREEHWGPKIITFEDRGPGAAHCDAVINAILPPLGLPNEYQGGDYALIRPEFLGLHHNSHERDRKKVLVLFGGTDAKGLTSRVAHIIKGMGQEPITHPPFVAQAMLEADYLICGAGQIVHEAAYIGIPTMVMAATQREASHGHLGPQYGNIFLGLAATVTVDDIRQTVNSLILDPHLRSEMWERGRRTIDGKGGQRIVHIIEGLLI
jgi:spore coat polysaccharide biosynthesis predicted glycosyltransferase SpsG